MNSVFSTTGIITMLVFIIILGIILGLLPLFMTTGSNSDKISIVKNITTTRVTTNAPTTTEQLTTTSATTTIIPTTQSTTTITSTTELTTTEMTTTEMTTTEMTTTEMTTTEMTTTLMTTTQMTTTEMTTTEMTTTEMTTTQMTTTQMTTVTTRLTCLPLVILPPSTTEILNSAKSASYSCPSGSPYVPSFLSLNTTFSFGYPINQLVVCKYTKPSKAILICPKGTYIHIYSTYYGIQTNTRTVCSSSGSSAPSMCFNQVIFDLINSTCENKSNCSILVTVNNLGDPCLNYDTQLMLQYQCMDQNSITEINQCPTKSNMTTICPAIADATVQSNNWCEPGSVSFSCSGGTVIQIICAYYGIDVNFKCPNGYYSGAPTICYSQSSFQYVFSRCNNRTSCIINGSPDFLGFFNYIDPCYGFSKAVYIQWKCVTRSVLNAITTTAKPTTAALPFCAVNYKPNGTCPVVNPSPLTPTFLNSTIYSFEYPVYQQIACSMSKMVIQCPVGTVIHIYAGYFGIQSTSYTSCYDFGSEIPKMCFYPSAFNYIKYTLGCESSQSCLIVADQQFKDACSAYPKQLFVQFQCVDSYALNSTISNCTSDPSVPSICPALSSYSGNVQEAWSCDGETMTITCPVNQLVTILCAFYGLHPSITRCDVQSMGDIPVCYFQSSQDSVDASCTGQNSCDVLASLDTFIFDPCENMNKVLYVQWSCS